MDSRLACLINDYQSAVAHCIKILEANGIARPASAIDWTTNDIPGRGEFPDGTRYFKHGIGCAVKTTWFSVDFDFGEQGQIDGFDVFRLSRFANGRLGEYGLSNENELEVLFDEACQSGELAFSGYILWYLSERESRGCFPREL